MGFINVVLDNKSRYTDELFTYEAEDDINVGQLVKVPFGKGNKEKRAVVVNVGIEPAPGIKLKKVISVDPDISLNDEMVDTALWMRQRYGITYLDALNCFIPNGKPAAEGKEKEPFMDAKGEGQNIDSLTEEQLLAVGKVGSRMDSEKGGIFLIHGVTGSGKTEVYMRLVQKALDRGQSAIMLVSEIALTKQIVERFIARFGKSEIAILHSKLTKRERFDEWMRLKTGKARIAIGARIGVFAPLENIGIIIMDEEHESTYKSDQTPKYETVDVAAKRILHDKGVLVLGSATPSITSYHRAKEGIYTLIEMKHRYNNNKLPLVETVDMKEELRAGNSSIYSRKLKSKIKRTLASGKQVMLFLNRRGYSTYISCKDCGTTLKCPECGITLVYHKAENAAMCHYCGRKFKVPVACPVCGGKEMRFSGKGTEQIEDITKEMFPEANVERLDLDTAKNAREINRIISNFSKGKTDILIGTQLIAKGLDFKNVGLVGVVFADVGLNIPDYRSSERTFQLITQVAGRAGRGDERGLVIVQSFTPDNYAIKAAARHDYISFYNEEIKLRKFMSYPPFTDLVLCEFTSESEEISMDMAEQCKAYIEKTKICSAQDVFAPKLSRSFKNKEQIRYHILIKCPKSERNKCIYYIRHYGALMLKNKIDCRLTVDVNPYSSF